MGFFGLFIWSIPVGVHLLNVEVFSTGLDTFVPASHSVNRLRVESGPTEKPSQVRTFVG